MHKRTIRRLAVLVATAGLGANALAVAPGFYMGVDAGTARNNGSPQTINLDTGVPATATPKSSQMAFGGFMGYTFNTYMGIEGGLTYYSVVNYNIDANTEQTAKVGFVTGDLVGVGTYPIGPFSLFGKLGGALVYEGASVVLGTNGNGGKYYTYFRPTFSLGAGYDLTQNWVVDLSWNRVSSINYLGGVDSYMLGFSYHFVNRYCGQFLCDD